MVGGTVTYLPAIGDQVNVLILDVTYLGWVGDFRMVETSPQAQWLIPPDAIVHPVVESVVVEGTHG